MKSSTGLVALLILTACGCAKQPAAPAPPPEPFKTVADSKQLMLSIVIPASNAVWAAAAEAPKDDDGWLAAENQAIALAESGNLLMVGSRMVDRENWLKYSTALIDASVTAVEAIRARDTDKLNAAGNTIYEVCEACHQKYMPQPPAE